MSNETRHNLKKQSRKKSRPLARSTAGDQEQRAGRKAVRYHIHVTVKNVSEYLWSARGRPDGKLALNAGDIWFDVSGDNVVNNLDARTTISHDLYPGEEIDLPLQIKVPATPGEYVLEIDMVQEGVSWFKERGSTPFRVKVHAEHCLRIRGSRPGGEVDRNRINRAEIISFGRAGAPCSYRQQQWPYDSTRT